MRDDYKLAYWMLNICYEHSTTAKMAFKIACYALNEINRNIIMSKSFHIFVQIFLIIISIFLKIYDFVTD